MNRSSSRTVSAVSLTALYVAAGTAAFFITRALGLRSPILAAGAADLIATVFVFAGSVVFDNSSLYDPYWSVAPVPIAFFWAFLGSRGGDFPSIRAILVLILLFTWAARLTYNCMNRWKGVSEEDWRYSDFRRLGGGAYWAVSFFGFHFFPTILVFLGCLSLYPMVASSALHFRLLDVAALVITAGAIWIETRADRELRLFRMKNPRNGEILDTGVWAYSRHPNYFGEVLFWWGLYLFALAANPAYWWTVVGPLSISFLFVFVSVPMMERHMAARHPDYAERQGSRPPLVPWFFRR